LSKRGTLSRQAIVAAAAAMVDRDGIEGFSMRRLGAEMGVDPMAIYHHVPNKAALLSELVRVFLEAIGFPQSEGPWQDRIRRFLGGFRAHALAHPGLFRVYSTSGDWSPEYLRMEEWFQVTLGESGFPPEARVRAARLLMAYAENFVFWELTSWVAPHNAAERAQLQGFLDSGAFPAVAAVARHITDIDPDTEFAFGLDATLLGLEASLS